MRKMLEVMIVMGLATGHAWADVVGWQAVPGLHQHWFVSDGTVREATLTQALIDPQDAVLDPGTGMLLVLDAGHLKGIFTTSFGVIQDLVDFRSTGIDPTRIAIADDGGIVVLDPAKGVYRLLGKSVELCIPRSEWSGEASGLAVETQGTEIYVTVASSTVAPGSVISIFGSNVASPCAVRTRATHRVTLPISDLTTGHESTGIVAYAAIGRRVVGVTVNGLLSVRTLPWGITKIQKVVDPPGSGKPYVLVQSSAAYALVNLESGAILAYTEAPPAGGDMAGMWEVSKPQPAVAIAADGSMRQVSPQITFPLGGFSEPGLPSYGHAGRSVDLGDLMGEDAAGPGDGTLELVAAAWSREGANSDWASVRAYVYVPEAQSWGAVAAWVPYGAWAYGVAVQAKDLEVVPGDPTAKDELLTAPGPDPMLGAQVRGFDAEGNAIAKLNFYAYGTQKYGCNVGAENSSEDPLFVTGPGPGTIFGPQVRGWVFDGLGVNAIPKVNFNAYNTLQFGVNVGAGDIEGDGHSEIATGPGPSAAFGAQARGWNFDNTAITPIRWATLVLPRMNLQGLWVPGRRGARVTIVPDPNNVYGMAFMGAAGGPEQDQYFPSVLKWSALGAIGHSRELARCIDCGAFVGSAP